MGLCLIVDVVQIGKAAPGCALRRTRQLRVLEIAGLLRGPEGEHAYDDGPEAKLGPSGVRHHEDGSVSLGGEKVDNPGDYKGEPISGGPNRSGWAGPRRREELRKVVSEHRLGLADDPYI